MKQGILIIIFIIILVVSGLWDHQFIVQSFTTLEEKTLTFKNAVLLDQENINTPENEELLTDLQNFWEKREKLLCLFINHQHMEEVNIQLATIEVATNFNNSEQVLTSIELILSYIKGYPDFAIVSWESIF